MRLLTGVKGPGPGHDTRCFVLLLPHRLRVSLSEVVFVTLWK